MHLIDHCHLIHSNKHIIAIVYLIFHCTMSAKGTESKWGVIPPYLEGVSMEIDYDGQHAMCVAFQKCDDRALSKNGKVTFSRGRIFKHDSTKTRIEIQHHKACIQKVQKERDTKLLTKDEFKIKCGHIFVSRIFTTVTAF